MSETHSSASSDSTLRFETGIVLSCANSPPTANQIFDAICRTIDESIVNGDPQSNLRDLQAEYEVAVVERNDRTPIPLFGGPQPYGPLLVVVTTDNPYGDDSRFLQNLRESLVIHLPGGGGGAHTTAESIPSIFQNDAAKVVKKRTFTGAAKKESRGGCFIATACYGDDEHPDVCVLREWRDTTLNRSKTGRTFVRIYYAVSPRLAEWLQGHTTLCGMVKAAILRPIVRAIEWRK